MVNDISARAAQDSPLGSAGTPAPDNDQVNVLLICRFYNGLSDRLMQTFYNMSNL